MIDFNRTEQHSLQEKTHLPAQGSYDEPTAPTDADYRSWADGLQQRAARVTAPGLAAPAHRAAHLAQQSLTVMKQMQAEIAAQNPLSEGPPPPSVKAYGALNREFVAEMRALQDACPA